MNCLGIERETVKPRMFQTTGILPYPLFYFTIIPFFFFFFKCRKGVEVPLKEAGSPWAGSERGWKKASPVAVRAPQPQEQQQDEHQDADGPHRQAPLPPVASVAQFPPFQVSVLTSLPDVANNTAVTTHKQRSAVSPGQKNAFIFQTQYPAASQAPHFQTQLFGSIWKIHQGSTESAPLYKLMLHGLPLLSVCPGIDGGLFAYCLYEALQNID